MKTMKLNIKLWSFLAAFLMVFTIAACDDDNDLGQVDATSLDSLITEANDLIATTEEGTSPGDYKPGSKKQLQDVLTWVDWKIANAESQDDVADAAIKLQTYIDIFKTNIVSLAVPIIGQSNDTYIQISDNIKPLFNESFTIETKIYVVDLATKGYSNNIFATEQSGPDSGFVIRYFGDGTIHLNVGSGSGWNTIESEPGVIKAGEWMHIAFVNEISSQKLYVNGVEILSQDKAYMPAPEASFVIGNGPTWTDRVINGMVKDVRVWSNARTEQQISDNQDAAFENTEEGLAMYFPFDADLGTEFKDNTGKYTATFKGDVTWAADGIPPVIVIDFSELNTSIATATSLKAEVVEGTNNGDYPIGTKDYIQELIDEGNDLLANAKKQDEVAAQASSINSKLKLIKDNLVADATGIMVEPESDIYGFSITPNYTPQGDYTIEMDIEFESLGYGTAVFFYGYSYGIWATGYEELTEENVLNSGALWNFTDAGSGWQGPKADALTIKPGNWQHVALVHDNTARTTTLYVDGIEMGVDDNIGTPNIPSDSDFRLLGSNWGSVMHGSIKDFRMWDVAKAAADLNADIDGTEDGLQVYFPLEKVAGVKFKDVTGNYEGELKGVKWNIE
ncbi:concanavalin A-like lectin/glucanase superfamily protein [Ancylomarina subtilis]|uniref:Concanavalin A-like lectin/glucanase superfamily protein n=1 Tax=Ancylomarina subtilis TaxID=1639035 RepID=A0A4Q7V6D0_9BACT|nr:LamG domain-containing protein [Ancylomarina subtilis]RZT91865.1 concanavalin A-like lectin/glucanase superfamily protein [Ancylomarina subtilis]